MIFVASISQAKDLGVPIANIHKSYNQCASKVNKAKEEHFSLRLERYCSGS